MAKDAIKLAGPDVNSNYKVLSTRGTLRVLPGKLYSETYVKTHLLCRAAKTHLDVTIVMPQFPVGSLRREFIGTVEQ